MPHDLQKLPVRVRPARFETPGSLSERARTANDMTSRSWKGALTKYAASKGLPKKDALEPWLEEICGLRPDHFGSEVRSLPTHADGTECGNCRTGLQNRFACSYCRPGSTAELYPHDESRTCRRHRRWIGPGTIPEQQFTVGREVIAADRIYQRLRKLGVVDAHRIREIEECVEWWAKAEVDDSLNAGERFRLAVSIARELHDLTRRCLHAEAPPTAELYERLADRVSRAVAGASSLVLTDLVWLLVRPVTVDSGEHRFSPMVAADPGTRNDHSEQVRSCVYPRQAHFHLTQFLAGERPHHTRFELIPVASVYARYECDKHHEFRATRYRLNRASDIGRGCAYCSGQRALEGFNSLADTHPHLVATWDFEANGDLRPEDLVAGSTTSVFFLCEKGHSFPSSPRMRAILGVGCGYCVGKLVSPLYNSLSLTHPEISAEWHPFRNGPKTPADVTAGSRDRVWWLCPTSQHEYQARVEHRTAGTNCKRCMLNNVRTRTIPVPTRPGLDEELATALSGLAPRDAHLFSLVAVKDYTVSAAARVLGISPSAARARVNRIRMSLQRQLTSDMLTKHLSLAT